MNSTREALQSVVTRLAEVIDQLPPDPPEVPERVEVWPENDEHLRGDFWENRSGLVWKYDGYGWVMWQPNWRRWDKETCRDQPIRPPFTRTTDPSQPRKFGSLADIPEDVERVAGKYLGHPCELARSPLSGTGWMMRVAPPYVLQQWIEYMGLDEDDLTDIEEVIDHE